MSNYDPYDYYERLAEERAEHDAGDDMSEADMDELASRREP